MRMSLVLSVVLALVGTCLSQTTDTDSAFSELFTLDCNRNIHVLSSHRVLATDVALPFINSVYQTLQSAILNRARCHCPSIQTPNDDLNRFFNIDGLDLLRSLQSNNSQVNTTLSRLCSGRQTFSLSMAEVGKYAQIVFPGTFSSRSN